MTEEGTDGVLVATGDGGFVQFGIPGVSGGLVRLPLLDDAEKMRAEVVRGLKVATYIREKHEGAFPAPAAPPPEHNYGDGPAEKRGPPKCPRHNRVMKQSRNGKEWYCSAKVGDGYCEEKIDG